MIVGIGTDIVEIARIKASLDRLGETFAQRILTPPEMQEYLASRQPERLLAKRFAAKEAMAKALGTGIGRGVSWQHMLVCHNEVGAPFFKLSDGAAERLMALGGCHHHLSISDEQYYATAFVVLSGSL